PLKTRRPGHRQDFDTIGEYPEAERVRGAKRSATRRGGPFRAGRTLALRGTSSAPARPWGSVRDLYNPGGMLAPPPPRDREKREFGGGWGGRGGGWAGR